MSLITESKAYKPFRYPWAYEAWLQQQRVHWLPEEVPMADDIRDWKTKLTESEKNLLTQIFRFFTQGDIEVNDCYMQHYMRVFKPVEVKMMLSAFSNIESVHVASYSHLLDSLGMPESEYSAFLGYDQMRNKSNYMKRFNTDNPYDIALTLAAFGAFTEGLQLFSSFAILLNFPRFNKLKGMGQIIAYSVRDETLHCENIIKLFHTWVQENPEIDKGKLHKDLLDICMEILDIEDNFIDLAFEQGGVEGLAPEEVKQYIRYIAQRRLQQLGIADLIYDLPNPLPWLDTELNGVEHANFFEAKVTGYTKAATTGDWGDAF